MRHKTFVEFELYRLLDEKLTEEQKTLLYEEADEVFDVLTRTPEGVQKWEKLVSALTIRAARAKKSIIGNL